MNQEPPVKKRKRDSWRRFRFTLNNFREDETAHLRRYLTTDEYKLAGIRFMVLQTERAPTTGTLHYQGYCELSKQMRSAAVHKIPGFERIALLGADRSRAANITYCTKTATRVDGLHGQCGVAARLAGQEDRQIMISKILDGGYTALQAVNDHPDQFLSAHAGIIKMIGILQKPRNFPTKVHIYYGPTGSGKSWKARHDHPEAYPVKWPEAGSTWWWDFYHGGNTNGNLHDTVIMDEFRHNISYGRMLSLIDRGSFKIKYHGGMTEFNSHTLILTTNIAPHNWYPSKDEDGFSMLLRRFHDYCTIYNFVLPDLPHWQMNYQGDTKRRFEEIRFKVQEHMPERNVPGPAPRDGANDTYGNTQITGRKRSRQGEILPGPYGAYGQT